MVKENCAEAKLQWWGLHKRRALRGADVPRAGWYDRRGKHIDVCLSILPPLLTPPSPTITSSGRYGLTGPYLPNYFRPNHCSSSHHL